MLEIIRYIASPILGKKRKRTCGIGEEHACSNRAVVVAERNIIEQVTFLYFAVGIQTLDKNVVVGTLVGHNRIYITGKLLDENVDLTTDLMYNVRDK